MDVGIVLVSMAVSVPVLSVWALWRRAKGGL
jgi:hypothetical protein